MMNFCRISSTEERTPFKRVNVVRFHDPAFKS